MQEESRLLNEDSFDGTLNEIPEEINQQSHTQMNEESMR